MLKTCYSPTLRFDLGGAQEREPSFEVSSKKNDPQFDTFQNVTFLRPSVTRHLVLLTGLLLIFPELKDELSLAPRLNAIK